MKRIIKLRKLTLIVLVCISATLFSQKPPSKFGKVSIEELQSEICPIDSNAHAYFIFDFGVSDFRFINTTIRSDEPGGNNNSFQLYYTRHLRIKILDNEALSWGDFEIPLYKSKSGIAEATINIKACTYNLVDGQVVKTKLSKNDIIKEETNKLWNKEKFALPNVRKGSIIEIEYSTVSDFFFNLQPWYFQHTIPTLQSEYHVRIPEYYNYHQTQKGYFQIKREEESRQLDLTLTFIQKAEGISVQAHTYTNTYNYKENSYSYYAKDIPTFPIEKYLKTENNYLSKIEFELQYTNFPYTTMKYYTTSWEKINENLNKSNDFGMELKKTSHLKKDVELLKQQSQNKLELLSHAYNHIKNKMAWNEFNSRYVTTSLSSAYRNGTGNCADINLNLVALLRELGIESYPVVLSTQKHGVIHPAHPSVSSFNYVIAMAKIDNDTLLLDATDYYADINLLPYRCLNDKGRIVNDSGGDWIQLMDYKAYKYQENFDLVINDNDGIDGSSKSYLKGYASYVYKKDIKSFNNTSEYKESIEKENKDLKIDDIDIQGLDTNSSILKMNFKFKQDNWVESAGDISHFKPVYQPFITKNPFKLANREYPVEFNHPYTVQQVYTITVPKKYTITETPKKLSISSPDRKIKYMYGIQQIGNKLSVNIMFSISKTMFLPNEYEILKNMYQMIVDQQNQLVVLKNAE